MLMLQPNQAWRDLQTGSVWKRKVDTLCKQHQMSPNQYGIDEKYLLSLNTEWACISIF